MGYVKRKEKYQESTQHNTGLIVGLVLFVFCVGVIVLLRFFMTGVPPSQPVDSNNRTEVQEDDNVHLTRFLGYEFGKVYSMHDQMLENPWFGFLTVSVNFDEPLRCLRFGKDTYELIVKDEITELVSAFENKYGMKFLTHGDTEANYRGKHTSIRIWFSPNKKDSFKGTLRMEVEDVQLAKEWLRKYEQEHKEQQKADIERM